MTPGRSRRRRLRNRFAARAVVVDFPLVKTKDTLLYER